MSDYKYYMTLSIGLEAALLYLWIYLYCWKRKLQRSVHFAILQV